MELIIRNTTFETIAILDVFESLIWTERYYKCGDFEISVPIDNNSIYCLQKGNYVQIEDSDRTMIIENFQIITDVEKGNFIIASGRSLESILERRIVWGQTVVNGSFQDGLISIIDDNIINPVIQNRKIDNFIVQPSTDPDIISLDIDTQYTGDYIYTLICNACVSKNIGFKVRLIDGFFIFEFFKGVDRSYNQEINPYVVFSPEYDTLLNSKYLETLKDLRTITLVAGEGQGSDRKTTVVENENYSNVGIDRREMFTDARDLSQTVNSVVISDEQYITYLTQRGCEKLYEASSTTYFDGEAITGIMYEYNKDFQIGDIVQIVNEYGFASTSRITEIIISQDESGTKIYPTFTSIE